MVINTHYKFIFVHIPKTAGTSVMRSLQALQGNSDQWLAKTKHETLAEFQSRISQQSPSEDKPPFPADINFFTFGFLRNPWDRMSSFYRFLCEKRPRKEIDSISSFKDFLTQAEDGVEWIQGLYSMKSQLDFFTSYDGIMKMDFLGHFEFLNEDIETIAKRIGCPIVLPHQNRSSNTGRDYRNDYDEKMIKIVASRFSEEITHFGYKFDKCTPAKRCSESINRHR